VNCKHAGCNEPAIEDGLCLRHHPHVLTDKGERVKNGNGRDAVSTDARQQASVYISDEQAQKKRCKALNAKGEPCRSTSIGSDGLCAAHSGRAPLGTAEAGRNGAERSAEVRRKRVEERDRRAEEASMSLGQLLKVRALERREELVRALIDAAVQGREVPALRVIFDRLEGKVIERHEVLSSEDAAALDRIRFAREKVQAMSPEERMELLHAQRLRAVPDES